MEPLSSLDAALARADAELAAASGSTALCRIDGSGGPTPYFVKRAEGARAALGDVRKRVRRGAGMADAATASLDGWRADLTRWEAKDAGPWVAYCEGGCASVETLIGALVTSANRISDDAGS